jgi:hypothetical protein
MVTVSHVRAASRTVLPPMRLVLGGMGAIEPLEGLLAAAAPRLAAVTGLPLRPIPSSLHRQPERALEALHRPADGGWLAPLPLDPGLPLELGGSWAETLGAWRQPTLLLLDAAQMATGWPAAATALLRQWQVPLVGLIQWGGAWNGAARHRDGLPWLGALGRGLAPPGPRPQEADHEMEEEAETVAEELALRLRQRWCRLVLA